MFKSDSYETCEIFLRARFPHNDVWINLERNWLHFYWLTGETPHTLSILVDKLNENFDLNYDIGRPQCITVRNQVNLYS